MRISLYVQNIPTSVSGVYVIRNIIDSRVYVGSGVSVWSRAMAHKRSLVGGYHWNEKIQRFYDKYGGNALEFDILEEVGDRHSLIQVEQFWIDHFSAVNTGFNINPTAMGNEGYRRSEGSSESQSIRMSGSGNPRYGKKVTSPRQIAVLKAGEFKPVPVTCIDADGRIVKIYHSSLDTSADGFSPCEVRREASGASRKSKGRGWHKGYFWRVFRDGDVVSGEFSIVPVKTTREMRARGLTTPVVARDCDGSVVLRYESMSLAQDAGYDQGAISRACSGKLKRYRGLYWEKV